MSLAVVIAWQGMSHRKAGLAPPSLGLRFPEPTATEWRGERVIPLQHRSNAREKPYKIEVKRRRFQDNCVDQSQFVSAKREQQKSTQAAIETLLLFGVFDH